MVDSFAGSQVVPGRNVEILDASGANVSATKKDSRFVWVAEAGIAKIDYTNDGGTTTTEVLQLQAGWNPLSHVTKLYRYYTGSTPGTVKAYIDDGTLTTNAIKLRW